MTGDLVLDEHRTVDGTRPLRLGIANPSLHPAYLDPRDAKRTATCFVTTWAARFTTEPPATCLRVIRPGFHFLAWTGRTVTGRLNGQQAAYCAPCAVREWAHWQVSEIEP